MVCIARQRRKFDLGLHGYQLESFLSYGTGHLSGRQKIGKGGTIKVILAVYLFNHEAREDHEDNKNIKKTSFPLRLLRMLCMPAYWRGGYFLHYQRIIKITQMK